MTNKFESKCLQKILRFKLIGKRMLHEGNVLPRANEQPFLSALHAKNDTANAEQTLLAINLASQKGTTKLYVSSRVRKRFKL